MTAAPLAQTEQLIALRRTLHRQAELSGLEQTTANILKAFLEDYPPDELLEQVGGTGLVAIYHGNVTQGPTILFRAELDALPIAETNTFDYRSVNQGVSHKCGHDGHMAILAGLGSLLHQNRPDRGRVALLFQPAEETGEGALAILQDPKFTALAPDYVFALHNLPGYPLHQVVVRNKAFAAASVGMIVALEGAPSHAAEPENGNNPGAAMAELILEFNAATADAAQFEDLTLLTVIHARLGEIAFGTNPGFATVMATLRSFSPSDLRKLKELTADAAQRVAQKYKLKYTIKYVEEFPASINHALATEKIALACNKLNLSVLYAAKPFRWSEDFGHFTHQYTGALFGLGAGTHQAQLHHADYDFPDELITTGARLFYTIAQDILNHP